MIKVCDATALPLRRHSEPWSVAVAGDLKRRPSGQLKRLGTWCRAKAREREFRLKGRKAAQGDGADDGGIALNVVSGAAANASDADETSRR